MWTYEHETGKLKSGGIISSHFGNSCLNDLKANKLGDCEKNGYKSIKFINFHTKNQIINDYDLVHNNNNHRTGKNINNALIESGTYTCPTTGLVFQRNLNHYMDKENEKKKQVLMGSGIFSKVCYYYYY